MTALPAAEAERLFYRQSGWMILANLICHGFGLAVNFVAPWMAMSEYGLMVTMLQVVSLMMIPAMG